MANRLKEHLNLLEDEVARHASSPAFIERLNVIRSALGEENFHPIRSLAAPYYGTDLGVRYFTDPSKFYKAHCEIFSISPIDDRELVDWALAANLKDLSRIFDSTILFFGDYSSMKLAIESRWTQIINSHDYSLLIQAGVILAATGDAGCIELFDQAAQVAETDSGAYAAHHRAAAYFTKRQHDISSAESRLKLALSFATGEEKYVNIALMKNLDALIQVKAGREAINYLREAEANLNRYLSKPHLTGEQISRAARYRSQVAINMAQLLLAIGETQEALAVMLDNIHSARDTTFDYLDEALGEASYTAYLAKNYTLAVSLGAEAFWRTYSKGSVEAMRSIREIVSAASLKEGKNEYAEYVANTIDNDPLGLQGLSNTLGNTGLR